MAKNVETIRGLYEAFGRGDVPSILAALAPDVSWTEAGGSPYGGTYRGPDAVLQNVFMRIGTEWDGYSAVAHEIVDGGDTVVALGTYDGTYRTTGKRFQAPFAHVWKLRDGKIASFHQHTDTALIRQALG